MSERLLSPAQAIQNTLKLYNPNGLGVLIGTSAIHWAIASKGGDSGAIASTDVDVLTSQAQLLSIHEGLPAAEVREVRFMADDDTRLKVIPSEAAKKSGVLELDVVSDSGGYEDPLIFTRFKERIYGNGISLTRYIEEHNGVRYLQLPFIFWWKASIGRESDLETLRRTIMLLHDQNIFGSLRAKGLFDAIEKGRAGLRFEDVLRD